MLVPRPIVALKTLALALAVAAASVQPADAARECPIPAAPEQGPVDDVKDLLAHHWSHGTWFRMPLGYLNPQGPVEMIPILTDPVEFAALLAESSRVSGYDAATGCFDAELIPDDVRGRPFSFWYPTGEYIEFDLRGPRAVTDCPDGDCDPADPKDRFSVYVSMDWGPLPGRDPEQELRLGMLLDWAGRAQRGERQPLEGIHTHEHSWLEPITGTTSYHIFDDDRTVIFFTTCADTPADGSRRGGYCRGWFHDRASGVVAFVVFPFEIGQLGTEEYWRGPIGMIRQKLADWTITP